MRQFFEAYPGLRDLSTLVRDQRRKRELVLLPMSSPGGGMGVRRGPSAFYGGYQVRRCREVQAKTRR